MLDFADESPAYLSWPSPQPVTGIPETATSTRVAVHMPDLLPLLVRNYDNAEIYYRTAGSDGTWIRVQITLDGRPVISLPDLLLDGSYEIYTVISSSSPGLRPQYTPPVVFSVKGTVTIIRGLLSLCLFN